MMVNADLYFVPSSISINFVPSQDKIKDDIEGNFVFLTHAENLRPHPILRSQLLPAVCLASRKRVALGAADLTF